MFVGCLELWIYLSEFTTSFLYIFVQIYFLWFLALLASESALGVNNKYVEYFMRFPEILGSPSLDAWNSSYGLDK